MKKIIIALILSVIATVGCSPTEPGDNNGNQSDTTSHSFVWQKYTFGGGGGSSVLHDVAVINDTLAYAVGEIYINDATGQPDPNLYNLAKWNGKEWNLERVTVNFRGNSIIPPLEGIFCFSSSQIWLVGSLPIYGDGSNWTMYDLRITLDPSVSLSKAWGTNSQNMYFVGRNGSIVHYTNGSWQKIESGTNIDLQDIWGEVDSKTNQATILTVASNIFKNDGMKLLQIKNNVVVPLTTNGLSWSLSGVWFESGRQYYVVGDGIFQKLSMDETVWNNKPLDFTQYYTYRIRGNSYSDIIVVGSQGEVLHYNGKSWISFRDQTSLGYGNYYSVSIKGDIVAAVGQDGDNAVIIIGRRN